MKNLLLPIGSLITSIILTWLYCRKNSDGSKKTSESSTLSKVENKIKNIENNAFMYFTIKPSLINNLKSIKTYTFTDLDPSLFYYEFKDYNLVLLSPKEISNEEFNSYSIKVSKINNFKNCFILTLNSKLNTLNFIKNLPDSISTLVYSNPLYSKSIKIIDETTLNLQNSIIEFFNKHNYAVKEITVLDIHYNDIADCSYSTRNSLQNTVFNVCYELDKDLMVKKNTEAILEAHEDNILKKLSSLEILINEKLNNDSSETIKINYKEDYLKFKNSLIEKYGLEKTISRLSFLEKTNHTLFSNIFSELEDNLKYDKKLYINSLKDKVLELIRVIGIQLENHFSIENLELLEKNMIEENLDVLLQVSKKLLKYKQH